jgi:hypothetical protein
MILKASANFLIYHLRFDFLEKMIKKYLEENSLKKNRYEEVGKTHLKELFDPANFVKKREKICLYLAFEKEYVSYFYSRGYFEVSFLSMNELILVLHLQKKSYFEDLLSLNFLYLENLCKK